MSLLHRDLPTLSLGTALMAVLLVLLAGASSAAPLTRVTVPFFLIGCSELSGPSGTATLFADQELEVFASVGVWAPGTSPEADEPRLVSTDSDVARDGDVVAGTLSMVDAESWEDAGQASFTAVLQPVGDPALGDASPERSGNVVDRSVRTEQAAEVDGVLRLPDGSELPLDGCTGLVGQVEVVHNTPSKVVNHPPAQRSAACLVPGAGGHTLALLLFAEHGETFVELAVLSPDGEGDLVGGFGAVSLDRRQLTGTVELVTGEGEPAGWAVVAATIDELGPRIVKGSEGGVKFKVFVREFTLEGTVTVPGFEPFVLDGACGGAYERGWLQYPNPQA